jgi:hypothetical protein
MSLLKELVKDREVQVFPFENDLLILIHFERQLYREQALSAIHTFASCILDVNNVRDCIVVSFPHGS